MSSHQQEHRHRHQHQHRDKKNKRSNKDDRNSNISAHVVHVEESSPSKNPIVCSFPGGLPEALLLTTPTSTNSDSTTAEPPKFQWHGDRVAGKDATCVYSSLREVEEVEDHSVGWSSSRLCVGVYDRQTGELTLHPAAGEGRVYALEQYVRHYDNNNSNNDNDATLLKGAAAQYQALFQDFGSAKKRKVLRSQQANRVADAVGTGVTTSEGMSESNRRAVAAQKAALAAAAALTTTTSTTTGSASGEKPAATSALTASSAEAGVDQAMEAMRLSFLPKYNRDAKHPADVYSASDMAGDAGWSWVHRQVQSAWHIAAAVDNDSNGNDPPSSGEPGNVVSALLSAYQNNTKIPAAKLRDPWHASVKHVLQKASHVDCRTLDAPAKKLLQHKLQCAVLLNEWLTLYLKLRGKRGGTIPMPDETRSRYFSVPMVLALQFLERFTTSTINLDRGNAPGYVMSQAKSDSCVVHLFLLFLMAEYHSGGNHNKNATVLQSSNVNPLADDLRLDAVDVAKLLRQAGCTVITSKKGTTTVLEAVLKTPLTFPKGRRATGGGSTARR